MSSASMRAMNGAVVFVRPVLSAWAMPMRGSCRSSMRGSCPDHRSPMAVLASVLALSTSNSFHSENDCATMLAMAASRVTAALRKGRRMETAGALKRTGIQGACRTTISLNGTPSMSATNTVQSMT